jgi:hypothetical protein
MNFFSSKFAGHFNYHLEKDPNTDHTIISVSPRVISPNDVVTVQFHTSEPSSSDWIALYSPADVNISTVAPIMFQCCSGYCPFTPTKATNPVNDYLTTGKGSIAFNITNIREETFKFYYFKDGVVNATLVASSDQIVRMKHIDLPFKIRVLPTDNPNIFQLLWSTTRKLSSPYVKWGLKTSSYHHITKATTSTLDKSLFCGSPANTFGFHDLGVINIAEFHGTEEYPLLNNEEIYYVIGDALTGYQSKEYVFHLPPTAGTAHVKNYGKDDDDVDDEIDGKDAGTPMNLVFLGDLGVGSITHDSPSETVTAQVFWEPCPHAIETTMSVGGLVERNEISAVIHVGDIAYSSGFLTNWDYFLNMISPITSTIPYFTIVGNHEVVYPNSSSIFSTEESGGECGLTNAALLPLPVKTSSQFPFIPPDSTGTTPIPFSSFSSPSSPFVGYPLEKMIDTPWWSYDIGLVHLVGMSSEHYFNRDSEQYLWLEDDLKKVNRSLTPWIILNCHRPFYVDSFQCCEEDNDIPVMKLLQEHIEPLLLTYHVNLVFSGHFHDFQRQSAVYHNETVSSSKPVSSELFPFLSKLKGFKYLSTTKDIPTTVHFYENPQAPVHMITGAGGNGPTPIDRLYPWSEQYWENVWGYVLLSVVNSSCLAWRLINSYNDTLLDTIVLTQDLSKPWEIPPDRKKNVFDELSHAEESWKEKLNHMFSLLRNSISDSVFVLCMLLFIIGIIYCCCYQPKTRRNQQKVYERIPDDEEST